MMLSERPWKSGALLRLGGGIFLCMVLGIIAIEVVTYLHEPGSVSALKFFGAVTPAAGLLLLAIGLVHRPWTEESFAFGLALIFGCACGGFLLGSWAQHLLGDTTPDETAVSTMVIGVLSLHGAGLVLIGAFLREHGIGWADSFGFLNRRLRAVGWGAIGWLVGLPCILRLQKFSVNVMNHFHWEPKEQMPVEVIQNAQSWLAVGFLAVLTIVLVPLVEEILFRGILYPAVKGRGYPRLALWGSAVAFGAIHGNAMGFLPLTFFGIVLALLYELTGNLLAPVVTHGLFNAGSFLVLVFGAPDWVRHWLGG